MYLKYICAKCCTPHEECLERCLKCGKKKVCPRTLESLHHEAVARCDGDAAQEFLFRAAGERRQELLRAQGM
jgi:hypothetical protein